MPWIVHQEQGSRWRISILRPWKKSLQNAGMLGRNPSYQMDVCSEEQVVTFYEQVVKDFGSLDATINNAGILRDGLLVKEKDKEVQTFSLKKWQAVIDTNLTGVFLCGREAVANLVRLKKSGVIINISSIAYHGNFGQSNYSRPAGVASMTVLWARNWLSTYSGRSGGSRIYRHRDGDESS